MLFSLNKLLVTRILLMINFFLIISLICAYMAPYVSPAVFWPLAFFGLVYPVLVAANVLISLVWLFIRPWNAIYSLLLITVGFNPLNYEYQLNSQVTNDQKKGFTVVSFNVYNFSWSVEGLRQSSAKEEIFTFLSSQKPQIICMQDMPVYWYYRHKTLSRFKNELGMKNLYINSFGEDTMSTFSATGIFTNFPRIDSGEFIDQNRLSFAVFNDLLIGTDTVRVYSVHLASIKLFGERNMLSATGLSQIPKRAIPRQIYQILVKLKSAFISRAHQVDILEANISPSPYPVIVCGDFNDTPLSYTIHKIRNGLKDGFIEKGRGFGRTYLGSNVPLRIDNVFADPSFNFSRHEAVNIQLSDHLPVVSHLWLDKKVPSSKRK